MDFEFAHEFATDPNLYWELFFDAEYNVDLFKRLKMKEYKVLAWKRDGDRLQRTQRLMPERQVPAIVRKAIGGEFGYTETNEWSKARSAMDVVIVPTLMANKFDCRGIYAVQALGPGRVRRSFKGSMKVSFPLIGGQIEKAILSDMRESYEQTAVITREWIETWKRDGKTTGAPPVLP